MIIHTMPRRDRRNWKQKYSEYLKTPHWDFLRTAVMMRDGEKCVRCSSTWHLQAHHLIYREKFTDSVPDDLITLCLRCHRKEHEDKIPKKSALKKTSWQEQAEKCWNAYQETGVIEHWMKQIIKDIKRFAPRRGGDLGARIIINRLLRTNAERKRQSNIEKTVICEQ